MILFFLIQFAFADSAIVYSDNKDETWITTAEWNKADTSIAEAAALAACKAKGGKDCKVVKSGAATCLAIAIVNEGGSQWGIGQAANQKAAQDKSVVKCLQSAPEGSCAVRKSFCDTLPSGWAPNNAAELPDGTKIKVQPGNIPCHSPSDYNACKSKTGDGFGTVDERIRYCKMAFC